MAHLCSRSCDKSLRIDIRLVDILEVSQADLGKVNAAYETTIMGVEQQIDGYHAIIDEGTDDQEAYYRTWKKYSWISTLSRSRLSSRHIRHCIS